ncbi:MAG: PQQ-dependent sugar dehydrogenase [Anaerolineae bacterium]|nr:PQQ-dependent sugar dehydrogenase [Anaerolineae bacterium]
MKNAPNPFVISRFSCFRVTAPGARFLMPGLSHATRAGCALAALVTVLLAACAPAPGGGVEAQPTATLRPCVYLYSRPRVDPTRMCPEIVLNALETRGVAPIGSIAFDPEGVLYVARPADGAVIALADADGDGAMDAPRTLADGLDTPYGLAYHDGALYATGAGSVYRLRDADGDGRAEATAVLVDDLPAGAGYWTNSVGVGPDGRLYVSQGASCEACVEDDPRRGAILSFAPDGGDAQIVASGLHNPIDFDWHPATGALWATESSRFISGDEDAPPDELNHIVRGAHYGWPFCYGDRQVDSAVPGATASFCDTTTGPALTFPARAAPAGMAFYPTDVDAFPEMQGHLLVVTRGSWNRARITGYELLLVKFDASGAPTGEVERLLPHGPEETWRLSEIDVGFYRSTRLTWRSARRGGFTLRCRRG